MVLTAREKWELMKAGGRIDTPKKIIGKSPVQLEQELKAQKKKRDEEQKKLKKEIEEYKAKQRREIKQRTILKEVKLKRSPTGRFLSAVHSVKKFGVTGSIYARQMPEQQKAELLKRLKKQPKRPMPQKFFIRPQPQAPNFEQWVFNRWGNSPINNPCLQVERELFNTSQGHAIAGDREAFGLGREAFAFGHLATKFNNPVKKINDEVDFFSNLIK